MKYSHFFCIIIAVLLLCGCTTGIKTTSDRQKQELILCGWDEVFVFELPDSRESKPRQIWSWKAEDSNLPLDVKKMMMTTDDCKPVDGGRKILISSSGGAVVLVERKTGRALFYVRVPNAHSAEMLPGGRVAVAGSVAKGGNCLEIFDLSVPDKKLYRDPLPSGHGVVWDEKRKLLWALGYQELRAYQLKDWESANPQLEKIQTFKIPGNDGHDLQPVPGTAELVVTEENSVWLFDRDKGTFQEHPDLAGRKRVKSVMIHPMTGQMVYVQAEGKSWWAQTVHFINPKKTLHFPGKRLYKARWNIPTEQKNKPGSLGEGRSGF